MGRLIVVVHCLGGCAGQGAPTGGAVAPKSEGELAKAEIVVGPDAFKESEQALAAWTAYGAAKALAYTMQRPPPANESVDDFATELAGREQQSRFWADLRKKGAPPSAVLDKQVEIWRAGFLRELVVLAYGRPGWTISGSELDKFRFASFWERYKGDLGGDTPVIVQVPGGKRVPDVPFADFPDPASLPVGPASCARALDERKAAWAHFEALERRLGGVPVSATSTAEFAAQLTAAARDEVHKARGVTWVSPRVGHLAALEGFCAVERKDWPEALRVLARWSAVAPRHATPHLELAIALSASKRNEDALEQVTRALSLVNDGCTVSVAWRRRGFILIELGALDEAQVAYETSLKYDPTNAIARGELQTIAEMRRARPSVHASRGPGGVLSAPVVPPSQLTISACREGASR